MESQHNEHSEEQQIIMAVINGRPEGYAGLMRRYGPQVMALIARLVADPQDAEELVQDTFVKAFRHILLYDASKASLPTWLLRIAYNETLNHVRRRKLSAVHLDSWRAELVEIDGEEAGGQVSFPACLMEASEPLFETGDECRIQLLEEVIGELPLEERTLLILYYYENRSMQEIAEILEQKASTLASRLFRIRHKLHGMIVRRERRE